MPETQRSIGEHEARLDGIERRLDSIETGIHSIDATMNRITGGVKVAMFVAAALGAGAKWAVDHLWFKHA